MSSDWDNLSPEYRKRLTSNGITSRQWEQRQVGKASPSGTGYIAAAKAHDIETFFPQWDELAHKDKKRVAKLYEESMFGIGAGTPLTKEELAKRPYGVHTTHHRADWQIRDLMDLQDLYLENGGDEAEFWKDFREAYGSAYSAAA